MNAGHTPGAWLVEADGSISAPTPASSDVATSRITICEVLSGGVGIEQAEANRRLIAAAPDLLAACRAQHEAIDRLMAMLIQADPTFRPTKSVIWPVIVSTSTVIAKATGAAL